MEMLEKLQKMIDEDPERVKRLWEEGNYLDQQEGGYKVSDWLEHNKARNITLLRFDGTKTKPDRIQYAAQRISEHLQENYFCMFVDVSEFDLLKIENMLTERGVRTYTRAEFYELCELIKKEAKLDDNR